MQVISQWKSNTLCNHCSLAPVFFLGWNPVSCFSSGCVLCLDSSPLILGTEVVGKMAIYSCNSNSTFSKLLLHLPPWYLNVSCSYRLHRNSFSLVVSSFYHVWILRWVAEFWFRLKIKYHSPFSSSLWMRNCLFLPFLQTRFKTRYKGLLVSKHQCLVLFLSFWLASVRWHNGMNPPWRNIQLPPHKFWGKNVFIEMQGKKHKEY